MAEFLRPDADVTDGGWTNEAGGTSLFASLDETSPGDSDYIQSGPDPVNDVVRLRLSNPSGVLVEPVTVRYRYKKEGSQTANLTARLVQGASTTIAEWEHTGISASFVTAEQTLTTPQFELITDFSDLFVEMVADTTVAVTTTLDPSKTGSNITLSGGNLTMIKTGSSNSTSLATVGATLASGAKRYFEALLNNATNSSNMVCIATADFDRATSFPGIESGQDRSCGSSTDNFWVNETNTGVNLVVETEYRGFAIDFTNMRAWTRTISGGTPSTWNNNGSADPATNVGGIDISSLVAGTYFPGVESTPVDDGWTVNFGAAAYQAAAPSGFTNWV